MEPLSRVVTRTRRTELALAAFVIAALALGVRPRAESAATVPSDEQLVLARVPVERALHTGSAGPGALTASDRAQALHAAQRQVQAARRDGDTRHLGHAEATLAPLLVLDGPERRAARVLYATILQARHDFRGALRELDEVLREAPEDAQALLTRATVSFVLGEHQRAAESCAALSGRADERIVIACRAPLRALRGGAASALAELEGALVGADAEMRAWLLSLRGELSYWYADTRTGAREAERALTEALRLAPEDRYTRGVYADLLLDEGRHPEVRALLGEHDGDDALALRVLLASEGAKRAALETRLLRRFAAAARRGDRMHAREEARLALARGENERALALAVAAFASQREPWDARVVLEAARAAGRPEAARPVIAWLDQIGNAAPRLRMPARHVGGAL